MGRLLCHQTSSWAGGGRPVSWVAVFLLYLTLKEVFWYELPRTLGGLAVGVRRLYLPSGVMNQVSDTKNRVVRVSDHHTSHPHGYVRARLFILIKKKYYYKGV